MISSNISVQNGHLFFAGQDTALLSAQYGTPLYLMDEDLIRKNCRTYTEAFQKYFPSGSMPLYASKACSFRRLYEIVASEGMGTDVVSPGEILTAVSAGFPMEHAFYHGNNKTDADIRFAIDHRVGYFVTESIEELDALEEIAAAKGIVQKILLRITPGIDTHTYEAINTGKVDSKFGSAIETGQADEVLAHALKLPHIDVRGVHCHVGSQVFAEDVFERTAGIMLEFIARAREKYGYETEILNLGGGYGVRYVEADPVLDVAEKLASVAAAVRACCARLGISMPKIMMEPGRSIVADAGMTLYTAGSVKTIPGYKNYVSVDGGMTDNPRFILYGARYTCYAAERMDEPCDFECSVVGRCCESGDIIQEHVMLPSSVRRGDLIAVCTTGAYNYSMASNYNRYARPAVVMLKDGTSYEAVRRESLEQLIQNDL